MSMKLRSVFLLFILVCCFTNTWAQETLTKIKFEGLKKTNTTFLNNYLNTSLGKMPSDSLLMEDVQRLKNIAGIGNATYRLDTLDEKIELTFIIDEVKTLLPIVNFGGIKDNFWFQLGGSDIHWNGKGQFFSMHYQNNDRRHSGQIYYRNPNFKKTNWGYSISLSRRASREPLYFPEGAVFYDYDNNSLGLTAIRNFGINRKLEFGGTYFIENYDKSESQFIDNPPGPDAFTQPKILSRIEYHEDFLNYNYFYLDGLSWRTTFQSVYNTKDRIWFHSIQFQGRQYIKIKERGNIAMRLRLAISTNNDSPFAPFVVDSYVNLRGVGNRIDRGTAQAIYNLEYRHTVYHKKSWGAQLVVFSDLGTWRNPGGDIEDIFDPDQFRHFIGGGFRLAYQKIYGATIRVDYGVDVFNPSQRGPVVGLGQYF